jgi:anti-sigma B factor antagonist
VSLSLVSRRVGEVTVVTCSGRIVAGQESESLQRYLDDLLPVSPHILLHLNGVDFIDSAGLGLLARYLTRVQNARGTLKVCALSPKIDDVLRVTRLKGVFQPDDNEADSIASMHRSARADASVGTADILCVDSSEDVLAYLRELLREAGYRAITAANLPDALILFKATAPKVIVISAELRASRHTRAAAEFNRSADAALVVELPSEFSGRDAADAGMQVLGDVRRCTAQASGLPPA